MSKPVDMIKVVQELPDRPRGRACVVLTEDYPGQKEWASKLALSTGMHHIDLLDEFVRDHDLGAKAGDFSVSDLFNYLRHKTDSPVLIVSGLEFLKATWGSLSSATHEFASRMENWNFRPALLFVLQYDKSLATRNFKRYAHDFVIHQKETLAL